MSNPSTSHPIAAMGCVQRVDFGRFTAFVVVYVPRGTVHHHAHEDLLSYTVLHDGVEIIVDPGQPTYRAQDRVFRSATVHNGLRHTQVPLCPTPGMFLPRQFSEVELRIALDDGRSATFAARNSLLRVSKQLKLTCLADDFLTIAESIDPGTDATKLGFRQCFAGPLLKLVGSTRAVYEGIQLEYSGLDVSACRPAWRAREYGDRYACAALEARVMTASVETRLSRV